MAVLVGCSGGHLYGLHFYRSLHRGFVFCGDFLTCYDGKNCSSFNTCWAKNIVAVANFHSVYVSPDLLLLQKKTENELYVVTARADVCICAIGVVLTITNYRE